MLTTRQEAPKCDKLMLYEDTAEQHPAVMRGLIVQRLSRGHYCRDLVIGIDPGHLIGLSVFYYGHEIEGAVYSSVEDLIAHIISVLGGLRAKRKIVRVGNGNMAIARQITTALNLKFCSAFELEFVDEQKTSRKIRHFNQRGKRDVLSAKYIARREGLRRYVLPLSITG